MLNPFKGDTLFEDLGEERLRLTLDYEVQNDIIAGNLIL